MYIFLCIVLIILIVFINKFVGKPVSRAENFTVNNSKFENIAENIGNYLSGYFYDYAMTIFKKIDFYYEPSTSVFLKELPSYIPFQLSLYKDFKETGVTLKNLEEIYKFSLWECTNNHVIEILNVLKPVVYNVLNQALVQAGLKRTSLSTIIHFRCADTPFVKWRNYYLQKYSFFKESLEKINPTDKTIILMNCSDHLSKKDEQNACSSYVTYLTTYLESLGYRVKIRCKTNIEDFADLFYAKAVISTGGSYSFMSGFFGKGQFVSTEHIIDNETCDTDDCNTMFVRGRNILHESVDSYYDVDKIYDLLTA